MSNNGDVPYGHKVHTHDACLMEVRDSDLLILIIGERYGGEYKNSLKSITRMEYETAFGNNIPVHTFIKKSTYNEHGSYIKKKKNNESYHYFNDNKTYEMIKIFEFIDLVRSNDRNNGYLHFKDDLELIDLIKKQLSGMVHGFLAKPIEKLKNYHVHLRITGEDGQYLSTYYGSGIFYSPKIPATYIDRIQSKSGIVKCNYFPNYELLNKDENGNVLNPHTTALKIVSEDQGILLI